jgi:peptidoglycan/xylan/chitin deacetylase (PgdA/CDA1 family)
MKPVFFHRLMPRFHVVAASAIVLSVPALIQTVVAVPGDARVAKWKDDRVGVFLLMFDDGWPGQVDVAVPELQKRNLAATFYMVPEKGEFKARAAQWAEAAKSPLVVYGNHTMTHGGVRDYEHAKTEIGECTRVIREVLQPVPGKPDRLVSYARPGVGEGKWTLSPEDEARILRETDTVSRPPFAGHGAVYHWKTLPEMTALAYKAVDEKDMNYLVLHGVERIGAKWQDFWPLKQDILFPLLDYLKEKQESKELWVTDHISWHQYKTERETTTVKTLRVIPNGIQLDIKSSADPKLYDLPLTLVVEVPSTWHDCNVSQGANSVRVSGTGGFVTFDVDPHGPPISIRPASP